MPRRESEGRPEEKQSRDSCEYRGPFVYRLGREIFIL